MTVGELLANYVGTVVFIDSSTKKEVCSSYGGSPIISQLQEFEVEEWSAIKSTANPKIAVVCQFTQVPPTDETVEQPETVETVEGE